MEKLVSVVVVFLVSWAQDRSPPPVFDSGRDFALKTPEISSAPVSSEPKAPVLKILSKFSSVYKIGEKDARVSNIELGAKMLDANVFEPGKTWSFNETVGPRTEERGFKNAPVYIMGEVFQDVGGGTCQVSSTVFAAALTAGFEIVRRQPHSRQPSYVPLGFDATVNYPKQCWEGKQDPNICFDLKLKNPYDFPVIIRTKIEECDDKCSDKLNKRISVELLGTGPVAEVRTKWQHYATPDFERRWRKGWKPGIWSKKSQSGKPGLRGALVTDLSWPDGRKTQDILISNYRPVDEVWWVGRDWEGGDPW